ncbi:MAG: hypothetical protein ABIR26_01355 [Ramlibacter sp.]
MTTRFNSFLLAICIWSASCLPAWAAESNVVGMVLDLQGPAQVVENGTAGKLQLLANLMPQTRIILPPGSKASITIYSTRSVYRLEGPSIVEATNSGLTVVSGKAPEVKSMGEKLVVAAQTNNLIPGAYRMRSLRIAPRVVLTSPETGTVLLDTRPRFTWEAAEAAPYTVSLQAESGGLSYNANVSGNSWALPDGVQLEYGKTYDWKVTYVSPTNGETQGATGKFSLATQAETDQFTALKPSEADPIEDWVFYAVMLQQRQIRAEARNVWKRIAVKRPDLERAAELAK